MVAANMMAYTNIKDLTSIDLTNIMGNVTTHDRGMLWSNNSKSLNNSSFGLCHILAPNKYLDIMTQFIRDPSNIIDNPKYNKHL